MAVTPATLLARTGGDIVTPTPVASSWHTLVAAGGVATQDASVVTNPSTQITAATSREVTLDPPVGQAVAVRLGYDASLSNPTSPVGRLFGRHADDPADAWMALPNLSMETQVQLAINTTTDVTDGTLKYTDVDPKAHVFDRLGCTVFRWGTQTALAGTGTTSNAVVQIKPV